MLNERLVVTSEEFLQNLQEHALSFASAVATNEGDWIIKGFIDVYRRIYTISVDTKIVSKVLELLLFPRFVEFAAKHDCTIELSPQQNFYPDLTFIHRNTLNKFAVDIKSTYRILPSEVNGMTLGAFTGYFRNRDSAKNTTYPYNQYTGHFVLGVIYSKSTSIIDERQQFTLDDLHRIPSVIRDFQFSRNQSIGSLRADQVVVIPKTSVQLQKLSNLSMAMDLFMKEHYYHVGSHEHLRHAMLEALITNFSAITYQTPVNEYTQLSLLERQFKEYVTGE
jgi:hypothetical protein